MADEKKVIVTGETVPEANKQSKAEEKAADKAAEAQAKRVPANVNTTPLEPLLLLDPEALAEKVKEREVPPPVEKPLGDDQVRALLALERSGQNRTEYVKILMKRLRVDSPYEVTDAGPGFTNDVTAVTKL